MGIFDKVKIKTAVGRTNKFDLDCQHLTTQDFYKLRPVFYRECMPGESLRVEHSNFARLMPMEKPMMGSAMLQTRGFFVPYRIVFPYFNDFISDTESTDNGTTIRVSQTPWVYNRQLAELFITNQFSNQTQSAAYDFAYEGTKYNLAWSGRQFMTVLNSLGISVDFTYVNDDDQGLPISLLNIMAYMKVYADWYCPSAYNYNRELIENALNSVRLGGHIEGQTLTNLVTALSFVLDSKYSNDYFTSAFDNPQVPNDGTYSSVVLPDFPLTKTTLSGASNNHLNRLTSVGDESVTLDSAAPERPAPYIGGKFVSDDGGSTTSQQSAGYVNRGVVGVLSQYMIDSLKALTDYIKRYQLVGSRTLDRYASMFGVQLESAKLNRSIYLGKDSTQIEVADVMATANTDTADGSESYNTPLGDYAGKGIAYNKKPGEFSYKTDEFGCFLLISTILPKIGYVQGVQRFNLHIDRFDFFTPDFDGLGTQAIARGELYNDGNQIINQQSRDQNTHRTGIFGYTPRYGEYAVPYDFLSSDFRFGSRNAELQKWHLFRMFSPSSQNAWNLINKHTESFLNADNSQYDRIFNYDESDVDHFVVVHYMRITSHMPKKPLFDQYDWDDGRAQLVELNGTTLH